MKTWLLGMVAICFLIVLLELMLSEGTTKKYVQGILRLSIIFVMLSPIAMLIQKSNKGDVLQTIDDVFSSTNAEPAISSHDVSLLTSQTAEKIRNKLFENGIECDVKIVWEQNEIKNVIVTLRENGISSDDENIHTNEKIIRTVTDTVKIDKDKIIINGSG